MIKSMTGYGRAQGSFSGGEITVEVKSVNNRYLDCGVKLPRGYAYLEEGVKSLVQKSISRGKVDVYITINSAGADNVKISPYRQFRSLTMCFWWKNRNRTKMR